MKVDLLIDSAEFLEALKGDLERAKESIYLQTLSFEGDATGQEIAQLLLDSPAKDVKIIVDFFTKFKLSDRLLWWPWNRFDPALRKEMKATLAMFKRLTKRGAQLRIIRDERSWFHSYFATNHKKTISIDDQICYLGGINLCDHNFYWHDLMFRFENREVTEFFKQDFLNTMESKAKNETLHLEEYSFYLFDGQHNEQQFIEIFSLLRSAQKSIYVISPYLSWPFTEMLREISLKGIEVTILTPLANNYPLLRRFIGSQFNDSAVKLRYYLPRMSHMKAMLIDERILVAGSSNFDLLSYRILKENVVVIRDVDMVEQFKQKVLQVDLAQTQLGKSHGGRQFFRKLEKGLDQLCVYFNRKENKKIM